MQVECHGGNRNASPNDLMAVRPPRPFRLAIASGVLAGTLLGCGGDGAAEPLRSYTLVLQADDSTDEYTYLALAPEATGGEIDLRVGDEVTFEFDNTGSLIHDLQVVAPDGTAIAVAAAANPGSTTSVTVLFEEAGYYRLNCLVDNHLTEHGMQAIVEVTDT